MHAPQHPPKQNQTKPEVNKKVWTPPTDADFVGRWWRSGIEGLFVNVKPRALCLRNTCSPQSDTPVCGWILTTHNAPHVHPALRLADTKQW